MPLLLSWEPAGCCGRAPALAAALPPADGGGGWGAACSVQSSWMSRLGPRRGPAFGTFRRVVGRVSEMATRPLLAGRHGGSHTPAPAWRFATRAAVALAALAALAACVCAALLAGPGAPDELYLPGVSASPRARAQVRLSVDGSTMLVTSPSMSSVLGAREAQVEEDADAEEGAGAAAGEGAESDADRVREKLGEKEDEARAASRYEGDDNEDRDLSPQTRMSPSNLSPADEDYAAKSDKDEDEYVDDIDIPARHSLAASRGRDVPLTSLNNHVDIDIQAPPAKIEITPYDPAATVSLTKSEWHSGSCQNEGYTHDLKSQTGPQCPAFQALTEWKVTHNGCRQGQMKTEWKCASVQVFKCTLYTVLSKVLYILWYQKYSIDYVKLRLGTKVLKSILY